MDTGVSALEEVLCGTRAVRLHVAVAAPPTVLRPQDLLAFAPEADLVELRLDLLGGAASDDALAAWIAASPRPVLATIRSRAEGGAHEGSPDEAASRLRAAARAGAAWVDAEAAVLALLGELPPGVRVLASAHERHALPEGRADARKLARPCARCGELDTLIADARRCGATGVPYGVLGPLREVAATRGFLFGSGGRAAVVPGQPCLADLLRDGRVGEVGPSAARYALLGTPSSRSPSPALHNAVFRQSAIDAIYVSLPDLRLDDALIDAFAGFSVTAPLKQDAAARAERRDEATVACGAANTLVRDGAGWIAANTDALAVEHLVPPATSDRDGAIVVGAGGFAAAAIVALRRRGYTVRVVARPTGRARELASRLGLPRPRRAADAVASDAVIVHATPLVAELPDGLARHDLTGRVLVDAPYAAEGESTALASAAARHGASTLIDGRALLVEQAFHQSARFVGAVEGAARAERRLALDLALDPPQPLVLIGHRGSGKTTVGRIVARELGRPFVDLDEEVERLAGRPAGAVLMELGDEAFRRLEAALVERLLPRRGLVLAAGGGTPIAPGVADRLARSGASLVRLDVPRDLRLARMRADPTVRPIAADAASVADDLARREAARHETFTRLGAASVDAGRSLADVVKAVRDVAWEGRAKCPNSSP